MRLYKSFTFKFVLYSVIIAILFLFTYENIEIRGDFLPFLFILVGIILVSYFASQMFFATNKNISKNNIYSNGSIDVLFEILNSSHDKKVVLDKLLTKMVKLKYIVIGGFYLYDDWNGTLEILSNFGIKREDIRKYKIGDGLVGQAAKSNKSIVIDNVNEMEFDIDTGINALKPLNMGFYPIKNRGKLLGVMVICTNYKISEDENNFFNKIIVHLGSVLSNIKQFEEMQFLASEVKEKNTELSSQKQFAEAVLDSMSDGVVTIDKKGNILTWSNGAEKITGFKARDVIGKKCYSFLESVDEKEDLLCSSIRCPLKILEKKDKYIYNIDLYMKSNDGGRVPISLNAAPIIGDSGEIMGIVEVFRDTRIEKEAIESIKEANKAKSEFLATMSHELRTPLNSVIGFADLLHTGSLGELNNKQKRYVDHILNSGQHLLSLINDVLDLSKVESRKIDWRNDRIDLHEILNNSISIMREKASDKDIKVFLSISENINYIKGDERKIKQIIYNLLSNAIKFTPENGKVGIKADKTKNNIRIEVWDTGIGIPKELHNKIFEPFSQGDSSLSRSYEGTGLGLNLVKKLTELGGGQVHLESEVGKGSRFIIEIPIDNNEKLYFDENSIKNDINDKKECYNNNFDKKKIAKSINCQSVKDFKNTDKYKALIIEDDYDSASILASHMESIGWDYIVADNGELGIKLAHEIEPDIITLDIMMPDVDGWETLTRLKNDENLKDIPTIVISIANEKEKGYILGASDYLVKPVTQKKLEDTINNLVLKEQNMSALIIDDEPKAVEIISEKLSIIDFYVIKAYDGNTGIYKAKTEKPNIILLDIMMPEMDGFEVLERLKSDPETKDIPIIVLTAKILSDNDKAKLKFKASHIAQKSEFTKEKFLELVSGFIERVR